MSQGAQQHADLLAYQHDTERVIEKAQHEKITPDEAALLMWAAGLPIQGVNHEQL